MYRSLSCAALANIAGLFVIATPSYAAALSVLSIYQNSGDAHTQQLNSGVNNPIDTIEINCPKTACVLILNAMVDVEDGDPTKEWLISAIIDNQAPNYNKTGWQGAFLQSGYVTGNWQAIYGVAQGNHTIEFFTYGGGGTYFLNAWSNTITVTAP
jgi:hypothetical protein